MLAYMYQLTLFMQCRFPYFSLHMAMLAALHIHTHIIQSEGLLFFFLCRFCPGFFHWLYSHSIRRPICSIHHKLALLHYSTWLPSVLRFFLLHTYKTTHSCISKASYICVHYVCVLLLSINIRAVFSRMSNYEHLTHSMSIHSRYAHLCLHT